MLCFSLCLRSCTVMYMQAPFTPSFKHISMSLPVHLLNYVLRTVVQKLYNWTVLGSLPIIDLKKTLHNIKSVRKVQKQMSTVLSLGYSFLVPHSLEFNVFYKCF